MPNTNINRIKQLEVYKRDKTVLSKLTKNELLSLIQSYKECERDFAIESYDDIIKAVHNAGIDHNYEQQYIIALNNFNVIIDVLKIDSFRKGTVEFEADVLFNKLSSIPHVSRLAFVHNHPTGGHSLSEGDKTQARILYILSSLMGYEFKDYIILTKAGLYSIMYDDPEFFNELNTKVNNILESKVLKDIKL